MAVLIKDAEADHLIRRLAERTGQSLTEAVRVAVEEKLQRTPLSENEIAQRQRRIAKLIAEADAMPTVDHRTPDEIIGYNEHGHFD
jgi:antitoxin VapB